MFKQKHTHIIFVSSLAACPTLIDHQRFSFRVSEGAQATPMTCNLKSFILIGCRVDDMMLYIIT